MKKLKNKCLNCGFPAKNKFCSLSCSMSYRNKQNKGKTFIEIYGEEKANKKLEKMSKITKSRWDNGDLTFHGDMGKYERTDKHKEMMSDICSKNGDVVSKRMKEFFKTHKNPMTGTHFTEERSREQSERYQGEGNPNYRGENCITTVRIRLVSMLKYKQWRTSVFERDGYLCTKCKIYGKPLEAHHLKSLHLIFKDNRIKTNEDALNCSELWDISNGQTLCTDCHKLTENYLTTKGLKLNTGVNKWH